MSDTIGSRDDGTAIATGLVPSSGLDASPAEPPFASWPLCGSQTSPALAEHLEEHSRSLRPLIQASVTETSAIPCAAAFLIAASPHRTAPASRHCCRRQRATETSVSRSTLIVGAAGLKCSLSGM